MRFFLCFFCLFSYLNQIQGNGLQIELQSLDNWQKLNCSLRWENSWNLDKKQIPYNHDAIWLFVKARKVNGVWEHLDLSKNQIDFICSNPALEIITQSDQKGIFVKAKSSANLQEASLSIFLSKALVPDDYEIEVYGIEMVYIPEEAFFLGDGTSIGAFQAGDGSPFYVSSEASIPLGQNSASLSDTILYAPATAIPETYPKGYQGFYTMKYEISQAQYADFLNSLDYEQQKNRMEISPDSEKGSFIMHPSKEQANRNGLVIKESGQGYQAAQIAIDGNGNGIVNENDDGQNRACNFLSWPDLAAYLDWAALRPFSSFEFEKASRGPEAFLSGEYAWGNPNVQDANSLILDGTDQEQTEEIIQENYGLASHGYAGPAGPLRCGFAANENSTRAQAGVSYYGLMEMSGNLWERCINVSAKGLDYDGQNGNGQLDENGQATISSWNVNETNVAAYRGGAWNSGVGFPPYNDLAVSDRYYSLLADKRRGTAGGRGCRTPK